MAVEFENNSIQVKDAIEEAIIAFLHEEGGELAAQAARNSRVGEGQTKGSWDYVVDEDAGEAAIGSPLENAIWEELGTGEYAVNHNGRKTPWYVPVETYHGKKKPTFNGEVVIVRGKNGKEFYKTNGKKPTRALFNAFEQRRNAIIKRAESLFRGLGR